ncbi:hypothetical protein C8R43DRAFT_1140440 [Mycena crocata]|nr:hypothetical protein C8R43DRAFT_1140440 [Mycena crocata]
MTPITFAVDQIQCFLPWLLDCLVAALQPNVVVFNVLLAVQVVPTLSRFVPYVTVQESPRDDQLYDYMVAHGIFDSSSFASLSNLMTTNFVAHDSQAEIHQPVPTSKELSLYPAISVPECLPHPFRKI